jgi:hypothetical protein
MPIAYIRPINPPGALALVEIIALSPGSPPDRPHPGPTPPGPVDPGWSPPWAQVPDPDRPHPSHPIVLPGDPSWGTGLPPRPVDPGYSPPWAQVPEPGLPPSPGPGVNAVVIPMPLPPEGTPPPTPPEGMPAGSTQVLVWFGPGTKPAMAWVAPYVSTRPGGVAPVPPQPTTPPIVAPKA